jgi:hypothetical protein
MSSNASHRYPPLAFATLAGVSGTVLLTYGVWLISTRAQDEDGIRGPIGFIAAGAGALLLLLAAAAVVALLRRAGRLRP